MNTPTSATAPSGLGPILCIVGARPNFMKMAPILRAMAAHQPPLPALLVHTGQHYDELMSEQLERATDLRGEGDLAGLLRSGDTWTVE